MSNTFQEMTQDMQDRIRDLAYMMWESAGRQQGMAMEYWLAAEREVLATVQRATEHFVALQESALDVSGADAKVAPVVAPAAKPAATQATVAAPPAAPAPAAPATPNPQPLQQQKATVSDVATPSAEKPVTRKPAVRASKTKA